MAHIPNADPYHVRSMSVRIEEKMYNDATCRDDYLRKIVHKLVTTEALPLPGPPPEAPLTPPLSPRCPPHYDEESEEEKE